MSMNKAAATTTATTSELVQPFVAEFLGTLIFLLVVIVVVVKLSNPKWLIAALIGLGLAVGILICLVLKGPGYLNPAVAVLLGIKDGRSASYTVTMIAAEFIAVAVAVGLYYTVPALNGRSHTPASAGGLALPSQYRSPSGYHVLTPPYGHPDGPYASYAPSSATNY